MAPIRVGFIGLSKTGWGPGAHLPYLQASDNYQIVAICNSSIESSKAAIELYGLPSTTKAYGAPEEIAKDKDIDLVVCSVRVDRHLPLITPSLKAGKDVFVEWPLGKNLSEAQELLKLKIDHGVKNAVVGLQARQAPIVHKVKDLINEGRIGDVLSSTWAGQAGNVGPTLPRQYDYMADREVGGNIVTIHFGHSVDYVQFVLGYGFESGPKTLLANRRKTVQIVDAEGTAIETKNKTSDDTIFLNGTLTSGIPISMTLRGGKPFKDIPGLDWRIYGSTGEIRITASGPFLQIGYPDMKIQVHDFEKDTVEEVEVEKDKFDSEDGGKGIFGLPARNVGRLYKSLAEGKVNCSFEDAVERHALIDGMYRENGIDA
ncbi:related to dehydrogenases and related proteins [Phialocephala subalpina]|uniref:Related to dehydrogenases and related proteins n=1 Tax=Phialocephala subalpina TaxID=576137 RepID=A0A1L7WMT9_9HELO|nr:related to dehydrogenases and related proteins [Phialocephala subalpina]